MIIASAAAVPRIRVWCIVFGVEFGWGVIVVVIGISVFSPPPPTPPPSSITPFLAPFPAQNLLLNCRTDEPFLSQRAHSNTHLAISLTSFERSGEVKRSPPFPSFSAIPSPSKSGGKSQLKISHLLPFLPAHSSPFFTARLNPTDGASSLGRPISSSICRDGLERRASSPYSSFYSPIPSSSNSRPSHP